MGDNERLSSPSKEEGEAKTSSDGATKEEMLTTAESAHDSILGSTGDGSIFRSKRRYNIEDVFKMMSKEKAHDLNRKPPRRVLLTPRSAQAFLKTGVDPQLVKVRDLDSFWEPRIDPTLQRIHHEAYVKNRHHFIDIVRKQYDDELTGEQSKRAHTASSMSKHKSPSKSDATSTLVENEKKRLAKLRYRQEREIQQMIAYEMKIAKIQEEQNRKMLKEQARIERRKREELLRKKKNAEMKRERQLKKRAQEDAEEMRRRMLAREAFAKEQQFVEAQKQEQKRLRKQARKNEIERIKKAKHHAEETARRFKEQQDRILERMKEMQRSNQRREEYMEAMKERRHADLVKKRQMIEKRQHNNKIAYKKREQKRLMEYRARQRRNEEKRQRLKEEQDMLMLERRRLAELNERRRLMAVADAHRDEERRKRMLLKRQEEADRLLRRMQAEEKMKRRIQKEKNAMKREQRFLTVDRKTRIAEFKRRATEKSLREKSDRVERIIREREELLRKRQQASIDAKRNRDKVVKMMETIRLKKQWGDAEKILKHAFENEDAQREKITKTEKASPGKKRSNRANHMKRLDNTLPRLESTHKQATSAVAEIEMNMSMGRTSAAGHQNNTSSVSNSFMSPYDIPQTVVLSKPYKSRMSTKKKKKGRRRRGKKKSKQEPKSSNDMLLESLAQF